MEPDKKRESHHHHRHHHRDTSTSSSDEDSKHKHHKHKHHKHKHHKHHSRRSHSRSRSRERKNHHEHHNTDNDLPSTLSSSSLPSKTIPANVSLSSSSSTSTPPYTITNNDFGNKAVEFRYWLWYYYNHIRLFDLPKVEAQNIFTNKFVPAWNNGQCTDMYTLSIPNLLDKLEGVQRTNYKWGFIKTMNESEKIQLDTINDTVLKQTQINHTFEEEQEKKNILNKGNHKK